MGLLMESCTLPEFAGPASFAVSLSKSCTRPFAPISIVRSCWQRDFAKRDAARQPAVSYCLARRPHWWARRYSAYAASKAALIGLTRSLAIELAREGIRVNCIAPGMVQSEMTDEIRQTLSAEQFAAIVAQHPLGLGTTWDVACGAAYLLSDAARWMTGQTLVLDGGFTAQ